MAVEKLNIWSAGLRVAAWPRAVAVKHGKWQAATGSGSQTAGIASATLWGEQDAVVVDATMPAIIVLPDQPGQDVSDPRTSESPNPSPRSAVDCTTSFPVGTVMRLPDPWHTS
ncbi:MAG: hypothetical protein A3I00_03615 [Betaproteobacteria bacterium RIFCSPLOWO2_02_FULL_64_12]|nr:MAG: hypothetical protein A3G20_08130 [Acidobacteria bacterium RIFCSPLOWO2_12_FULL_59_11]OGA01058.1 MAG: hypothetical protein A3I00_03615 [Betaproteobacteria bacterium RIFCSPLOWO2_02_FULL_64_12]